MTRALIVSGLLIVLAGCANRSAAPSRAELMNSEAVRLLRADTSVYRIIYSPPVDLTKRPAPAPATSGPASPRRG